MRRLCTLLWILASALLCVGACVQSKPAPPNAPGPPHTVFGSYVDPVSYSPKTNWSQGSWCVDPANIAACASNRNTVGSGCSCNPGSFDGPLLDPNEIFGRWGTEQPTISSPLAITFASNPQVNPPSGTFHIRPRITNGAQFSVQCTWTQVCTGTISGLVAKVRGQIPGTGARLHATLCAGLSAPTRIRNTNRSSRAWIVDNANQSGNAWDLTQPLTNTTFVPPDQPAEDDGWANNDPFVAETPGWLNLREWDPSWDDIIDNPDSRPTLYGCRIGVGRDFDASSDTALVNVRLNGSAMVDCAIQSSTSITQNAYQHGSRAYGELINVYQETNAARTKVFGSNGLSNQLGTLIHVFGGRSYVGFFQDVWIGFDHVAEGGIYVTGAVQYDALYVGLAGTNIYAEGAFGFPAGGGSVIWGEGGMLTGGNTTWVCNSPSSTGCPFRGGIAIDGIFAGYADDDSVQPVMRYSRAIGGTGTAALDTAIDAGGFGGRIIGRYGSVVTLANTIPASPSGPPDGGAITCTAGACN